MGLDGRDFCTYSLGMGKRNNKQSKKTAPTYRIVQIDDEGTRVCGAGFNTPLAAAQSVVASWLDYTALAGNWFASAPDGGERFEIGIDDEGSHV